MQAIMRMTLTWRDYTVHIKMSNVYNKMTNDM